MLRTLAFAAALLCTDATRVASHKVTRWHGLVQNEDIEGLKALHKEDSDGINVKGNGGQTPLMFAVLSGKLRAVQALLELGADVTIPEKDGYTPVHAAGFQGRAEIMQELIAHGLNPRDVHADGYEPIHRACWGTEPRHTAALKVLLDHGVPYNAKAANGQTPLDILSNQKTTRSYRLLKKFEKAAQDAAAEKAGEL